MSAQHFHVGDFVRKKTNPGIAGVLVQGPIDDAGDVLWRIRLPDGSIKGWLQGTFELVPKEETVRELLARGRFGRKADFSQLLSFQRLVKPLTNNIYSLHSNRIDFYPHQFKPLLKFVDSPNQRLLIADDVGLGKTIEAGLILSELRVRSSNLQTVLIVCPSHLTEKWRLEMRHRFSEEFTVLGASDFLSFLNDYRAAPGATPLRGICSMQALRGERIREALENTDPRFELVVIDEAHHMRNSATLTHQLGRVLGRLAEALVLMTATPVQTDLENLFNLLRLLDEDHFQNFYLFEQQLKANEAVLQADACLASVPPRMDGFREAIGRIETLPEGRRKWFLSNPAWPRVREALQGDFPADRRKLVDLRFSLAELNILGDSLTRTRKREAMVNVSHREPQVLDVKYSPDEAVLYRLVLEYVRSRYSSRSSFFEKAALMTPQRRAASCLNGASRYYLEGRGEAGLEDYLASIDDGGEELPDSFDDRATELQVIMAKAVRGELPDSKYNAIQGFLKGLKDQEKVIIFSTFPSTLDYLQERLGKDGMKSVIISGRVPMDDRLTIIERFRDQPDLKILLSSEVGGEGLDLQFCSIIVNYDLPWNPMAVAQRIGRLDRLGQKSPVIRIINFAVRDTIDQTILERLYKRIGLFERSIGLTDGILGPIQEQITDAVLNGELTEEARVQMIEIGAQALEARIASIERMEERSDSLLISDSFLRDEVLQADRLHRFVSDEEVCALVQDFLTKYCPRTRLTPLRDQPLTYRIEADQALRARINGFPYAPGDRRPRFMDMRDGSVITFNTVLAGQLSELEHINVTHPMVRLVVNHYREHGHEFARATRFDMESVLVPPGDYLVSVHKLEAEGVRTRVQTLCVVVDMATGLILEDDVGETLVGSMITSGSDSPFLEQRGAAGGDALMNRYETAVAEISKRDAAIRSSLKMRDEAFRARRIASLRAYYDRKITRQRELANMHRWRDGETSQVKGFETRAKNLETECDERVSRVENSNAFDPETQEILAAVVRIHAPQ